MNEQPENTENSEDAGTGLPNFDEVFAAMTGSPKSTAQIEPSADLRAGASSLYQLFSSWVEAGFSRAEALQIVISLIAGGVK